MQILTNRRLFSVPSHDLIVADDGAAIVARFLFLSGEAEKALSAQIIHQILADASRRPLFVNLALYFVISRRVLLLIVFIGNCDASD